MLQGATQPEPGARAERIVKEAARLFAETGYAGTRMTDIAAAIGVTKPIIYRHFPSKQALFEHWVDLALGARAKAAVSWLAASHDKPGAILDMIALVAQDLEASQEASSIWRIAIGESDRFPQLAATVQKTAIGPVLDALTRALADGQASGRVKGGVAPQVLAELIIAPLAGHAILVSGLAKDSGGLSDIETFARAHITTIAAAWLA